MNVSRIYSRSVVSVPRISTLQDAAALMRRYHVGALLVTDGSEDIERAIGIVTDRDLVVEAMAEGLDPTAITVDQVMTPDIAGIEGAADTHEAMVTMRELGVRRLAVTGEGGAVNGILSLDDIVDALSIEMDNLAGVIRREHGREVEQRGTSAEIR
jgi:signal-transduction protein with cAMP-binding, CBS, and nucleotidyltransferase domain